MQTEYQATPSLSVLCQCTRGPHVLISQRATSDGNDTQHVETRCQDGKKVWRKREEAEMLDSESVDHFHHVTITYTGWNSVGPLSLGDQDLCRG